MADWDFDVNTKQATLWLRRGAIGSRSAVVNGNTQTFDNQDRLVSVVFPNPLATINLANIPLSKDDHDRIRDQLLPARGQKSGG